MGEVLLARDERVGREVAVKRLRGSAPSASATARFLREARIQARLEHPAIVPVYEIGEDAANEPFFAMKRISGTTLADLLHSAPAPALQRLLRAFHDVCLAVEFAHSRGVVHRDLKPQNIILGEFGEVYVLDWGLARIVGEHEAPNHDDVRSLDGATQAGVMLGTPGYMAPEQVRDAATVGFAADVYALGSTLFEILTNEPLHSRGMAALVSTTAGVDGSPAIRRPERTIAPELDALCVAALSTDPKRRPTASEIAERVEQFLDGDRDIAKRRALARAHVESARAALASGDSSQRAEAVRAAGHALAFDPESRDAANLITHLMFEPPRELPQALRTELVASEIVTQRRQSRVAAVSFLAIVAFLAVIGSKGVRSWEQWLALGALTSVMGLAAWRLSQRNPVSNEMLFVAAGNAVLACLLSRAFGSLILVPAVTCVMALSLMSYPQLVDRVKTVLAVVVAAWLLPVCLEYAGVIERTWLVTEGEIRSTSTLVEIGGIRTELVLVALNVGAIVVIGLFANALARTRRDAQRTLEIQAWHLRQLLPVAPETIHSPT